MCQGLTDELTDATKAACSAISTDAGVGWSFDDRSEGARGITKPETQ